MTISNVQKDLEVSWEAFEEDENGKFVKSENLSVEEVPGSNGRKCKITASGNKGTVVCLSAFVGKDDDEDDYYCIVTIK